MMLGFYNNAFELFRSIGAADPRYPSVQKWLDAALVRAYWPALRTFVDAVTALAAASPAPEPPAAIARSATVYSPARPVRASRALPPRPPPRPSQSDSRPAFRGN